MESIGEIHQATRNDLPQLSQFLDSAYYIHRHLDWRSTFDWIDQSPFLFLTEGKEVQAMLVTVPDPAGVAWIRCFAAGKNTPLDAVWKLLFSYSRIANPESTCQHVAVGLQDWFTQILLTSHFAVKQNIVVLEWNHHVFAPTALESNFSIRQAQITDLPEIGSVDEASFERIWVNTPSSLQAAYSQAAYTTVVQFNQQIVGYQLSTAAQFNAHLARLAVLPEFRHHLLGKALVADMLHHYSKQGVVQVTVNTQNDNQASLHLYESLGFHRTKEEYPVLIFPA